MDVWHLGVAAYFLITAAALTLTWREQTRTGRRSLLMNACAILACTLWPLALVVFLMVMRRRVA